MKKIFLLLFCGLFLFSIKGSSQAAYSLQVTDYGSPANGSEVNATGYSINSQVWEYSGCTSTPSIHIAIIDSSTCLPINNCNHNFGQENSFVDPDQDCINGPGTIYNCRARPENYFIYRSNDSAQIQAMAHVLDSLENGNYIIAYSFFPVTYSALDTAFRNVFQRLGSTIIASLPDTVPFIFFCKKGNASSVVETMGTAANSMITLNATYYCSPTGVSELSDDNRISIFPNPADDELSFQVSKNNNKPAHINMYDAFGKLVWDKSITDDAVTISIKNFAAGLYFVKIRGADFTVSKKVCVVHK